jgi:hypothetical protein
VTGALAKDFDPVRTPWNDVTNKLVEVLGAVASLRHNGMPIVNLTVPWPRMPDLAWDIDAEGNEAQKYVQIDIHYLHSPERFQWELSIVLTGTCGTSLVQRSGMRFLYKCLGSSETLKITPDQAILTSL